MAVEDVQNRHKSENADSNPPSDEQDMVLSARPWSDSRGMIGELLAIVRA